MESTTEYFVFGNTHHAGASIEVQARKVTGDVADESRVVARVNVNVVTGNIIVISVNGEDKNIVDLLMSL